MALSSMTGFARSGGTFAGLHWHWEIRSVNGKGLDIRCRLASGFDHLEAPVREAVAGKLKRGNVQVSLSCTGAALQESIVVNEAALEQIIAIAEKLRARIGGDPPRMEGLLALRGVLDVAAADEKDTAQEERDAAILASLDEMLASLDAMRRAEGERLGEALGRQIERIAALTIAARDCPARSPEAIRTRLAEQVSRLMDVNAGFDRERLHQEAAMLATRTDIQEELDRLSAHVDAARRLLASPEPAGRKFEFLAQEFNREANTLCAKASDRALTEIGLDLKAVIDQLREQVLNVE